jgi:hypothetical protein
MDEVGFVITGIDEASGYLTFAPVGGWFDQVLLGHRVTVRTRKGDVIGVIAAKPPHLLTEEEKEKVVKKENMFIDVGADSKAVAMDELGIRIADPAAPWTPFTMTRGNSEAHTMYLKGLYHYHNERTKEGNQRAMKFFEEAIKLDTKYATAYAALADCYSIFGDYGWLNPTQAYPKAKLFTSKAMETDPTLAESHASLGLALKFEWNLLDAEEEFKKAIELKPSYAIAHLRYCLLLEFMGRYKEAINSIIQADNLDPPVPRNRNESCTGTPICGRASTGN